MKTDTIGRCGIVRAGAVVILAGLVGACAEQSQPAPVFMRGAGDPLVAPVPALQVIVRRGQTLAGYAYTYHLPKSAIIAANGLRPPYVLRAGMRLTIPSSAGYPRPPVQQAALGPAVRPLPPASPVAAPTPLLRTPLAPPPQAAVPQPPPTPQTLAPLPSAGRPPQTIFPATATAAPTPPAPPPTAKIMPDVIPLDGSPPKEAAAAAPAPGPATLTPPQPERQPAAGSAPVVAARNPAAALPLPGEDSNRQASAAPAPVTGGRFPWPVRGRIVGNYGNTPGGGHNDGINIAAPLGTPVRAVDAGTVAYAGNEVKGYGNIVLIKHANGLISAYAHLDDVTVKAGETIAAGQVIAKVGETGGVPQPQLHFELRRGKTPVDPREFLTPSPSAAGIAGDKTG